MNNGHKSKLEDILVFLAVLRAGSTLAAAQTLRLTQTTVSRRIDALEHALGLGLFVRNTRGFVATKAARQLVTDAERIEHAHKQFTITADQIRKDAAAEMIRVTATNEVFDEILSPFLASYGKEYPNLKFETLLTNKRLDIASGEADIAFRHGRKTDDDGLIHHLLGSIDWSIYGSREYQKAHGMPATRDELGVHDCVLLAYSIGPQAIQSWVADWFPTDRVVMRCDNLRGLITASQSGIGLAPLPCEIADRDPNLVRCFPSPPEADIPFWLVVAATSQRKPHIARFADCAMRAFREHMEKLKLNRSGAVPS